MQWNRAELPAFLERLVQAGGYQSERRMARALGEHQETVWGWRRATRGPAKLEAFLRRYAERHGYDAGALVERWELVKTADAETDDPHGALFGVLREGLGLYGRVLQLPRGFQERYEARTKEITARVERELDEFLKLLESEYREMKGGKRRS
jgi:hypothetical protein